MTFVNRERRRPHTDEIVFESGEKKWKITSKMAHHHHHGGCEHESTDSDHQNEIGIQYSLYKKIDLDNLECLNETEEGSAQNVFKPYEERLNFEKVRTADAFDEIKLDFSTLIFSFGNLVCRK